jgi:hypothetical protein
MVELVVSMGVISVLLVSVSSAILIASKALPSSSRRQSAEKAGAMDQLASELACAASITELTPTAITFAVADRGHGPAGPETIRYAWSGTPGDPLTRQYNASAPAAVASGVTSFSLSWTIAPGAVTRAPRVLMVVENTILLMPWEHTEKERMQRWGYLVTIISNSASSDRFLAEEANADVMFVSASVNSQFVASMARAAPCGVVVESHDCATQIGMVSDSRESSGHFLYAVDTSHPITATLVPKDGAVEVSSDMNAMAVYGGAAPGARWLAQSQGSLCVEEIGGALLGGGSAPARRVLLPWGGSGLINRNLTPAGWNIIKRSLFWAAAPPVYSRVGARLAVGSAPMVQATVEILNQPRAIRP